MENLETGDISHTRHGRNEAKQTNSITYKVKMFSNTDLTNKQEVNPAAREGYISFVIFCKQCIILKTKHNDTVFANNTSLTYFLNWILVMVPRDETHGAVLRDPSCQAEITFRRRLSGYTVVWKTRPWTIVKRV